MSHYRIVSGTPRGGTSINMRIHGVKFDLAGKKFPSEKKIKDSDSTFRAYMKEKKNKDIDNKLNPKGFFEDGRYCMTGIHDSLRCSPLPPKGSCIKIIGTGLKTTDPKMISSVLFSLRHPFEVAEAQKDLPNVEGEDVFAWTRDLRSFLAFKEYSKVPTLISSYTDLCLKPKETLKLYSDFYNEDLTGALSLLEGHTPRPTPDLRGGKWDRVLEAYNLALEEDWEGVKQALAKKVKTDGVYCARLGGVLSKSQCNMCLESHKVVKLLKKRAERKKVDWDQEPCRIDCETMTVQESINKNHWR